MIHKKAILITGAVILTAATGGVILSLQPNNKKESSLIKVEKIQAAPTTESLPSTPLTSDNSTMNTPQDTPQAVSESKQATTNSPAKESTPVTTPVSAQPQPQPESVPSPGIVEVTVKPSH